MFSDENLEACYSIAVEDDSTIEQQERYYVTLTITSDATQSLVDITPNRSTVLIIDNDGKVVYTPCCECLMIFTNLLSTVLQIGFEMAQYTFSENAGQVTIHVARENTAIISHSFTVEVALLPTSTAREGMLAC